MFKQNLAPVPLISCYNWRSVWCIIHLAKLGYIKYVSTLPPLSIIQLHHSHSLGNSICSRRQSRWIKIIYCYLFKHSEIHAKLKIDQWILIQHSIKSSWLWFQIPHCSWHLRNYSLLSFGIVSEKNTHDYLKRLLK